MSYDKLPGEWYGPSTAAYVLRDLAHVSSSPSSGGGLALAAGTETGGGTLTYPFVTPKSNNHRSTGSIWAGACACW